MGKKERIVVILLTTCLTMAFTYNVMAGADWQEKQKQMYAKIPVKPGDVVDKSNWEKGKDLLPESFLKWVQQGDWILKMGEFKYDFDYTPEWYALSAQNAGRYGLGAKKEIIDLKTGKFPMHLRGMPFPDVDVQADPEGALKLMHNSVLCRQMNGSYDDFADPENGNLQWVGTGGYERGVKVSMKKFYYWNRPDGERPNPNLYMHSTLTFAHWPYDLTGTSQLYLRFLDGRDDSVYAYVPAIRRVKRLSGANRSDPFLGADSCMDDEDGWDGHNESMKWSYVGEVLMLCPKWEGDMQEPKVFKKNEFGAREYYLQDGLRMGWETQGWQGAPWAFSNMTWAPREMWIIKAEPLDPYYAYGMTVLYVDKLARVVVFSVKYNRAGEYWKTMVCLPAMGVIPDPNPEYKATAHAFNIKNPMVMVDDRTRHGTCMPLDDIRQMIDSPRINERDHTPQVLKILTK